jgi:hypothetical protein
MASSAAMSTMVRIKATVEVAVVGKTTTTIQRTREIMAGNNLRTSRETKMLAWSL